jgi:DNA polymerase III subunit gamma/tau
VRRSWINEPGQSQNSIMGFAREMDLVGRKSKTKNIPQIIFQLDKFLIGLFLRILYSGDGSVNWKTTPTVSYYSSSKELIYQVQHLLLRFGIIARIRYKPTKYKNKLYSSWALEITHRESLLIFIKEIGFIGEKKKRLDDFVKKLLRRSVNSNCDVIPINIWNLVKKEKELNGGTWIEVGQILNYKNPKKFSGSIRYRPSREKLRICGELFKSRELLNIAASDIYWDRIIEIKYTGDYKVCDLTIPETHNFVANDFFVHNTTVARLLAKAVNCSDNSSYEPCNKCESCLAIMKNRALDLIEIDAASNRGIDEVRELRERIRFSPSQGKYKVFVIDEAHQLTKEAFNALLKTLEEPPAHAIFVLATTEPHKMLPTILSRVQRFDFKKVSLPDIVKRLNNIVKSEGLKTEEKAMRIIALNSEGHMRDAESMLSQVIAFSDGKEIKVSDVEEILGIVDINLAIKFMDLIRDENQKGIMEFIDKFVNQGYDLIQFIESLITYARILMLVRVDKDLSKLIREELSPEQINTALKQAGNFSLKEISRIIEIFLEALYKMKHSSFPQLEMELATIEAVTENE